MNKYLKNFIKIFVSFIILYYLINLIGVNKIIQVLSKTNLYILLLAIPLKIITLLLGTVNINFFLRGIKKKIRFWRLFIATNLAWSVGLILPGKLGEFSLIYFLKKHNLTIGESTAVTILDKISTFIVISILGILGILKYFDLNTALKFTTIILIVLLVSLFALTNYKIRSIIKKYFLKSYSKLFLGFNHSFRLILNQKGLFLINLIITIIKWFFSFWLMKAVFFSLGVNVSIIDISFITSLAMLIALIPISIGGLGVRESIAVYLFNLLSVRPEITLSAYLISVLLNYLFGFVIILINSNNLNKINFNFSKLKFKTKQ